jgi:hypothetical protein
MQTRRQRDLQPQPILRLANVENISAVCSTCRELLHVAHLFARDAEPLTILNVQVRFAVNVADYCSSLREVNYWSLDGDPPIKEGYLQQQCRPCLTLCKKQGHLHERIVSTDGSDDEHASRGNDTESVTRALTKYA